MTHTHELYEWASRWQAEFRRDPNEHPNYPLLLDELLFHARLRFCDYVPFRDEAEYAERLWQFLSNVNSKRDRQTLLRLASELVFVDYNQIRSLMRDAYKRVLMPALEPKGLASSAYFDGSREREIQDKLRRACLLSITTSFAFDDFLGVNHLHGLAKPSILSENPQAIAAVCATVTASTVIIFEDVVGSGTQALGVIKKAMAHLPKSAKVLFIPIAVCFSREIDKLTKAFNDLGVDFCPVYILPDRFVCRKDGCAQEMEHHKLFRALITRVHSRVERALDKEDIVPRNPFGFKSGGALFLSYHNCPNNAPPLIHHKSDDWSPLFRRMSHSYK